MPKKNLPDLKPEAGLPAAEPLTDISPQDMVKLKQFIDDGMPGVGSVNETTLFRMMELYLSGSTYWQISNTMGIKRMLIVYFSHKYGWYPAKREYLDELQEKLKGRIIDANLTSQDFLLLLTQAWEKKIGRNLKKYLATDDSSHMDKIDLKEVTQLLKTIEMLGELRNEDKPAKAKTPAIGLNLGDGVTIERSGDDKVTITPNPKEKTLGDLLKKFADDRREEVKQKNQPQDGEKEEKEVKNEE